MRGVQNLQALYYSGSKWSKAETILPHILDGLGTNPDITEYREPFFGSGAIGINLLGRVPRRIDYWFNDLDPPLACFWFAVRDFPDELIAAITAYQPDAKLFPAIKKRLMSTYRVPPENRCRQYRVDRDRGPEARASSTFSSWLWCRSARWHRTRATRAKPPDRTLASSRDRHENPGHLRSFPIAASASQPRTMLASSRGRQSACIRVLRYAIFIRDAAVYEKIYPSGSRTIGRDLALFTPRLCCVASDQHENP